MRVGIGIDTGGTYTDVVVFDFDTKKTLSCSKALTTKHDLSVGILEALDAMPVDLLKKASLFALSTTLATNACVENKGGRAKLVFIGVDERVVHKVGMEYGLPSLNEICILPCKSKMNGDIDEEPDWNRFEKLIESEFGYFDSCAIVEIHSMNNNAYLENKAKDMVGSKLNIPVVCGYELSQELNSLQRGAGTLLNSRLVPVVQEFLDAVKTSLKERGIEAPIVVVRSDGTLMSETFTNNHPVETLLSGPAASVMGGLELTDERDAIVVDMGGTTTDCAIIKDKIAVKAVDGVRVGNWKTFVKGMFVDTYGLGGDSAVRQVKDSPQLFDKRVVPISVLAQEYPEIVQKLRQLLWSKHRHTKCLQEFFVLVKDFSDNPKYDKEEQTFCRALKNGPLSFLEAVEVMEKDIYTFNVNRLEQEGVIIRSGLTPTDVMHIKGDFVKYNTEAAQVAARFIANSVMCTVEELCDFVYDAVKRKIYVNIVRILLQDKHPHFKKFGISEDLSVLINDSWDKFKKDQEFVSLGFSTPACLIGIGAPIHIFLPDVAKALNTKCKIPDNAGVANAIGAIVSNICATVEIDIKPNRTKSFEYCFTLYGLEKNINFPTQKIAEVKAIELAQELAAKEARDRGAKGELTISYSVSSLDIGTGDSRICWDTKVTATAMGSVF